MSSHDVADAILDAEHPTLFTRESPGSCQTYVWTEVLNVIIGQFFWNIYSE